jgi:broad specificity phosphatase PhoE
MKLILVRHGETDWNLQQRVQGSVNTPLNRKGLEQARKVALRLKNEKIDAIYSSDLKRAKQTADAIAKPHKIPVKTDNLLRERSFGKMEGMLRDEYYKIRSKSGLTHLFRPPGGENYVDVAKRARRFISAIKKRHMKGTIVVVSHGILIRTMISILTKSPLKNAHEIEQHNTAVNVIELNAGSPPKVHYLNSTEHL